MPKAVVIAEGAGKSSKLHVPHSASLSRLSLVLAAEGQVE